jgi:recombination protein RecR
LLVRSIKAVQKVIDSFESLPGIGPKTAARLAYYMLHVPQERLEKFAESVERLKKDTKVCRVCFNIGEDELCPICDDRNRDQKLVCVVEQPLDLLAFEKVEGFIGVYHVLGGAINPLCNIGPDDLTIGELLGRLKGNKVKEIVLATNPTMEGEATAMYITYKVKEMKQEGIIGQDLKVTRIGRGLPTGADVEYADGQTLLRALEGRREV